MLDPTAETDPLEVFASWYDAALRTGAPFPDAMALATATLDGRPSVRTVLYKGVRAGGIEFFTNYESRKGRELDENPRAAVVFHWPALGRQVRMEGGVERLSRDESARYFASRPRDSQLSACVSPQSRPITSRAELERHVAELEASLGTQLVTCPEFWGGYRLRPDLIEFWVNRSGRLHDRSEYRKLAEGWQLTWLAP
jgi:pyridoxamine 5'-phosphate oxidase